MDKLMTATKQTKEKIRWIDMVRGGAILLVVIGHSGCPSLIYNFIYSFQCLCFLLFPDICITMKSGIKD